jgi:hypothetical protein
MSPNLKTCAARTLLRDLAFGAEHSSLGAAISKCRFVHGQAIFEVVTRAQLEAMGSAPASPVFHPPAKQGSAANVRERLEQCGLTVVRSEDHQGQSEAGTLVRTTAAVIWASRTWVSLPWGDRYGEGISHQLP